MPRAFAGVHTALPTPFRHAKHGAPAEAYARFVDEEALRFSADCQAAAGVAGVVPAGTTGESPTLSHDEHLDVVKWTVEAVRGRCLVIAGAGSNCTAEAVALTRGAARMGADATLQVVPYYNRPQQRGMVEHFRAVGQSAPIPMVLYNVPSRCGAQLDVGTVVRIAREVPNAAGIKDAHADAGRVAALRAALDAEGLRDFAILAGDDAQTLPFMENGADGVVSVASNVVPGAMVEMVAAQARGDLGRARALADKYRQLFEDLFVETNPVPVKAALAMLYPGVQPADVRLPLVGLAPENAARLRRTLGLG